MSRTTFGTSNNITQVSLGLLVGIEPRVAPGDGVVLQINVNESRLGRTEEGVVLSTSPSGETIRRPPTIATTVQSVVKAPAGKTVVVAQVGIRRPAD